MFSIVPFVISDVPVWVWIRRPSSVSDMFRTAFASEEEVGGKFLRLHVYLLSGLGRWLVGGDGEASTYLFHTSSCLVRTEKRLYRS
jgi:hypothetical protein